MLWQLLTVDGWLAEALTVVRGVEKGDEPMDPVVVHAHAHAHANNTDA